jgi:hypothetical protein
MDKKLTLNYVKHSPSSIFTKEDVTKLIENIDVEFSITISELDLEELFMKEEKQEEQKPYMMSLYDYLGRAAGKELGAEVCATATRLQETIEERPISNPKYTGNVHLYRREFLDEYFGKKVYEGEKK